MAEPEREQTRPLATASTPSRSDPEDEYLSRELKKERLLRRRCLQCCGCATAFLLLLGITIAVLAFTVFRVRDPKISMNSISIERLDTSLNNNNLRPTLNLTLAASVSVKNPNYASLKFTNTTTSITYGGSIVGEARTPPGNARARRTFRLNVTVDVIPERIVAIQGLGGDLLSGALTINSATQIAGRVKIIGIIKKHVDVRMDCAITVNITSRSIQLLNCERQVSL